MLPVDESTVSAPGPFTVSQRLGSQTNLCQSIPPPFGATLFYMKGTAPPDVTMADVYRAMYPFVGLQVLGLLLCIYFPGISLWLPRLAGFLE